MRNLLFGALTALGVTMSLCLQAQPARGADVSAQPIPGGWVSVSTRDDRVITAARFAIAEQSRQLNTGLKLLAIKHARHQVVAGNNFSMNLMILSEGKRRLVIAVVWVKPDGTQELTRWHWV